MTGQVKTNDCSKQVKKTKLSVFFWAEAIADLFLQSHEHNEAYKAHKETLLREVCSVMYVVT
jgi:hypothetical protein